MHSEPSVASEEIPLFDLHPRRLDFEREVLRGLSQAHKRLPCMYFYDERGSLLFDQICDAPEYYPTRTELGILKESTPSMAQEIGPGCMLIELGSGSSLKTTMLLQELIRPHSYVPVDISREHLMNAAYRTARRFPELKVRPVCADFMGELAVPPFGTRPKRKIVFFPGSTIGNFAEMERRDLLTRIVRLCQPEGGGLLIGIDLKKDRETLEAAYDDAGGVTAAFNRNLLTRINRELHADFVVPEFTHRAVYDQKLGRVEMHLVSQAKQSVRIGSQHVHFDAGESICTEYSYKFSVEEFAGLAADCGLLVRRVWTDKQKWFAVMLLDATRSARPRTGLSVVHGQSVGEGHQE